MQVLSKLTSVPITCKEYVHPWTDSCSIASAEFLIVAVQDSLRIYTAVYLVRTSHHLKFQSLNGFNFLLSSSHWPCAAAFHRLRN